MRPSARAIVFPCVLLIAITQAMPASPGPAAPPPPPLEGLLLESDGTPLQGLHDVRLRFMNASRGGELLHEIIHDETGAIDVTDGILRAPLTAPGVGLPDELSSALYHERPVHLEVIIDGELLEPRIRVVASTDSTLRIGVPAFPGSLLSDPHPEAVLRARSARLMLYGAARAPKDPTLEIPVFEPSGKVCSPEDALANVEGDCDRWLSPAGELPDAAALRSGWRNFLENGQLGYPPPGAVERAWERRREMDSAVPSSPESNGQGITGDTWVDLGPAPLVTEDNVHYAGRIRAVAVDPSNPDTIYAGAASGGVWKTTNGGNLWTPLTDFEKSLTTGSIIIDPADSNIIYVGTGEVGGVRSGTGVLKSVDGGQSWSLKGEQWFGPTVGDTQIAKIVLDPRLSGDPASNRIVLVACSGSGASGVYRSVDGGETWTRTIEADFTDLVIDPTNPNIVYAASPYNGIFKSTASGVRNSWNRIVESPVAADPVLPTSYFGRMHLAIVIDPIESTPILYASAEDHYIVRGFKGIWKSADGGANWTRVAGHPVQFANGQALMFDLVNEVEPNGTFGTSTLVDIGDVVSGTISSGTDSDFFVVNVTGNMLSVEILAERMGSDLDPELYLYDSSFQRVKNRPGDPLGGNLGFRNTNDERITMSGWAILTPGLHYVEVRAANPGAVKDYQLSITGIELGCQCEYDQVLAVDPTNPDVMYTGMVRLHRSIDGGKNWTAIADHGERNRLHNDIQGMAFHPTNTSIMFWATDGGLFKTTDRGDHWESINNNLSLVQIYTGMTQHPSTENLILIGMQDNGTAVRRYGDWKQLSTGDGSFTAVADFDEWYLATFGLKIVKYTNFGAHYQIVGIPSAVSPGAHAPFIIDPSDPSTLIAAGSRDGAGGPEWVVQRTTNGGDEWIPDDTDLGSGITALAWSPSHDGTQYAGTAAGTVWRTLDDGATWHEISWAERPTTRAVIDLAVAPDDEYQVYVAYGGWTGDHLFRVRKVGTGGTVSAVAISDPPHSQARVPSAPVLAVLVDPWETDTILIGTNVGIFRTTDGGVNWESFNRGLPNVSVSDLILSPDVRPGGLLRASTFGRGVWELQIGNDYCDHATPITEGSYSGYTTGAHGEGDASCEWDYEWEAPDVFYEYTSFCEGVVTIDTCGSSYNTVLSLHSDTCPVNEDSELDCNDDCEGSPCGGYASCISRPATPGETLMIRVAGTDGDYGNYNLNVSCDIPNDSCEDATTLTVPQSILGSTVGGHGDGAASCDGVDATSAGVWYRLIGNGNMITASLCNASTQFDTRLTVYCAGCGGQTCITAGDDECGARSQVSWCSAPGAVYHLLVHGAGAATGAFQLDVTDGASCPFVRSCAPGNNHCEQAQEITLSTSVGDNTNADTSTQATCEDSSGDVWFRWEPNCNGFVTFDTCGELGSLADTVLSLHDSCGGLEYTCNDDGPEGCGWRSQVSYPAVAGSPFMVRVADFDPGEDPDRGDFPLHHDFIATGLTLPRPGLYIAGPATGDTEDFLWRLDHDLYSSVLVGPIGSTGLKGLAYAPDLGLMYGIDAASTQMVTINLNNGAMTPFGTIGFESVASLAWDPWRRLLYGVDAVAGNLLEIDAITGDGTIVGPIGFNQVVSLALDPRRRVLYGVDIATDFLVTVDLSTGAGTLVGPLGGDFDRVAGLTFVPDTRALYGLQRDIAEEGIRIVRIDPETGQAVQVGPSYLGFDGFTMEYIPGLPDATAGEYFATHISPAGGCPAYDFADWNFLPPGLTADAYGNIQGVPVEPGEHLITFTLGDTAIGSGRIEAMIPLRVRPANDRCADASLIADWGYPFATVGATTDGPVSGASCGMQNWQALQGDIWYCYRAPCTGTVLASTCESNFDTMIAVYDGCGCGDGAEPMGCDDDTCGPAGVSAEIIVPVTAGGLYGIRVGGYSDHRGYGLLGLECAGEPAGACCREGSCATESAADCAVGGGLWLGEGSACTPDGDGDALPDECDACPQDPHKQADPGICGCGVPDIDTDADSNPDCVDDDDDDDGVPDAEDYAPGDNYRCMDADEDGCDDCTPGYPDPLADGTDFDADGYCNVGDCDDGYAATHPGAEEINDAVDNNCEGDPGFGLIDELSGLLGFFTPHDKIELSWTVQPGAADYQIARSNDPFFGACVVWQHGDPFWHDYEEPASGQVFYFLVRALAPNPGSWGPDSQGLERVVPCAFP